MHLSYPRNLDPFKFSIFYAIAMNLDLNTVLYQHTSFQAELFTSFLYSNLRVAFGSSTHWIFVISPPLLRDDQATNPLAFAGLSLSPGFVVVQIDLLCIWFFFKRKSYISCLLGFPFSPVRAKHARFVSHESPVLYFLSLILSGDSASGTCAVSEPD